MTKALLTLLGVSLCQLFSWTQVYNFQYLNSKNGLPQSQAYAIAFDDRQYAWIGTQGGGIAVYNGEESKYLTQENGLVSNRVYDLKWINGSIYAGLKGAVSIINKNHEVAQSFLLADKDEIAQTIIQFQGQVWIGTSGGLYTIVNDKIKSVSALESQQVFDFYSENNEKLWACTSKGIWQVNKPINRINKARGLRNEKVTALESKDGIWYIGTYGGGLWVYDKKKIKKISQPSILSDAIIHDVLRHDNTLWVATLNKGLIQLNLTSWKWRQYTTEQGLSNNHVKTLKIDYWGNLWIGTSGGGVSIFNNSPFVTYNKSNGLYSNYIYAVLKDRRDNLWVATQGLGVQKINDTSSVLFNADNGFKTVKSKALFEDSKGRVWVGTEGEGVSVIEQLAEKDTVYNFKQINGLLSGWVKCFSENIRDGMLYIGSANGIYACNLNDDSIKDFSFVSVNKALAENRVNDIEWSQNIGAVFFASNEGAGFVKNNKVVFIDQSVRFRSVALLDSVMYFGSTDKGVLRVKYVNDSLFRSAWVQKTDGLLSHNIYQLCMVAPYLWVGTEKGLSQYHTETKKVNHYGYDEGFEGVETNVNANFKDNNGQIWFGTTDGLYQYGGGKGYDSLQKLPPQVYFNEIQIFYQPIEETKYKKIFEKGNSLALDHTDNHIGFSLQAHHFTFQNKIKYRWKLEGVDKDWSLASKNKTATFSNLKSGNYQLLAQASIDNSWNMSPITFNFVILTPFWQQQWFVISYWVFGLLLITLIIYLVIKRQQRKNQILIEKIELEKSVLELEQKALRLQMNPHFIFNVLNSIHQLIILNDSSKARYALAKFSKLMRQVLENSRDKLVSIDDEMEMIQNYVKLEKLTGQVDFDFNVNIVGEVDTNEPVLPPLLVQPFIENAIIHGFKKMTVKGKIEVDFAVEDEVYLLCTIKDNGVGRHNAAQQTAQKEQYHKSTALQVTQERLANLNNSSSRKDFEIEDLNNSDGTPSGTLIKIRIKLP